MADRSPGVRVRTTAAAVAAVGAALIGALLAVGAVTQQRLTSAAEDKASARAEALEALVDAEAVSDPLPGRDPDLLAQIVADDGTVVAADRAAAGLLPFSETTPAPGETAVTRGNAPAGIIDDDGLAERGEWLVVVRTATSGTRIIVGTPLDEASEVFGSAAGLIVIGVVAVLVVVGAATWVLIGRALRPVEQMRAEAEQISEGALDRRLPVPNTADEVGRLAATLNDMLTRLDESARARRAFIADASHELRSPVAALRSMLDVAGPEPDADLVADLSTEVDRLARLVDDLLVLTRSDEAQGLSREEVDLDQLLAEEAAAMRRRSSLSINTAGVSAARAMGRREDLGRLIRNLTDNALRHAQAGVWLSSQTAEDGVLVTVEDDGPGIPEADRERIFERFVRLDSSRDRASGGAGLGLAVARGIARACGGDITAGRSGRGGALLAVRLPAAPE